MRVRSQVIHCLFSSFFLSVCVCVCTGSTAAVAILDDVASPLSRKRFVPLSETRTPWPLLSKSNQGGGVTDRIHFCTRKRATEWGGEHTEIALTMCRVLRSYRMNVLSICVGRSKKENTNRTKQQRWPPWQWRGWRTSNNPKGGLQV